MAVIIVSYNTRDLLRACLAGVQHSAARHAPELAIETIVVDNASHDDSAEMVAREFPDVTLIALDENRGYTGGNNIALRRLGLLAGADTQSPPDFVLLLNPDTVVEDDALLVLARFLAATPEAGACGPRLAYGDGAFQHGAFAFPGLAQIALDVLPIGRLPGAHRLYEGRINGRYPPALWNGAAPFPVDFVLGAALMARAETIRRVGGLDEGFFMYCEEMDWCLRVREAGWQVYAVPHARITHYEGQSSRQVRWPAFERLWRSRLRFYAKHAARFGPLFLPAARVLVRLGMALGERAAWRRFATGAADGREASAELEARRRIATL